MDTLARKTLHTVFALVLFLGAGFATAQSSGTNIFQSADALLKTATEENAELLSPSNWEDGQKYYTKAKDYDSRGRLDKAQEELVDAEAAFTKAIADSKLGKINFASALKARALAVAAEAQKYEPKLWEKAEKQFEKAARKLEDGNVSSATEKSDEAKIYYGDAELAAIKTGIVGNARKLIATADDEKVYKEAPISLNKAKDSVAQAEALLDKDRYSTEQPIALAATAEYEARHATYIAKQLDRVDDDKISGEQLILSWEQPLQNIAMVLDVTTDMSAGPAKSADASVAMAKNIMTDNAELTVQVARLNTQLGGQEAMVEETRRMQAQLASVEALFSPDQARVVREGNNLVLRLVGLSFITGQSVIETRYFGLLKKVQEAIEIFPDKPIVIEGHTDSVGSDAVNNKLSQDRANSVREYLIANLGLPESRVNAEGFGKSKPIATNETEAGRIQNRRIDVVIVDARTRAIR